MTLVAGLSTLGVIPLSSPSGTQDETLNVGTHMEDDLAQKEETKEEAEDLQLLKLNPFGGKYRLTQALFVEFAHLYSDKGYAKYTLKDQDHKGYPSLLRLYLELDDPTEYLFATQYFDDWETWEKLCRSKWFQPYLRKMRERLAMRTRAHAVQNLKNIAADTGNKNYYLANKLLLELSSEPKSKNRVGRPAKEIPLSAPSKMVIDEDLKRIKAILN